jgi:hypothetical protein
MIWPSGGPIVVNVIMIFGRAKAMGIALGNHRWMEPVSRNSNDV